VAERPGRQSEGLKHEVPALRDAGGKEVQQMQAEGLGPGLRAVVQPEIGAVDGELPPEREGAVPHHAVPVADGEVPLLRFQAPEGVQGAGRRGPDVIAVLLGGVARGEFDARRATLVAAVVQIDPLAALSVLDLPRHRLADAHEVGQDVAPGPSGEDRRRLHGLIVEGGRQLVHQVRGGPEIAEQGVIGGGVVRGPGSDLAHAAILGQGRPFQ